MSMQALQWAHEQKVGHPEAKLVLILLAAASGWPEAACFPDLGKLAEQAEIRSAYELRFILSRLKQQGLVVEIEPDFGFLILPSDEDSRALAADPDRARREFADYLPSRRQMNPQK
ncbi:hypothetical protein [Methylocystis sp. SC2]|uniref:hypothetical protein n=1 Tax=Methylocystis sp. (strain SC2) TaxID=187303 RepID=UPI00027AF02A|nr:hypothetical protein [Methylocystis sp. SC2]CCJ07082.1 Hypothetical protein BN69_1631 [Methylocystis sp. SC2]